jgi:hypothetical protein
MHSAPLTTCHHPLDTCVLRTPSPTVCLTELRDPHRVPFSCWRTSPPGTQASVTVQCVQIAARGGVWTQVQLRTCGGVWTGGAACCVWWCVDWRRSFLRVAVCGLEAQLTPEWSHSNFRNCCTAHRLSDESACASITDTVCSNTFALGQAGARSNQAVTWWRTTCRWNGSRSAVAALMLLTRTAVSQGLGWP